MFTKTHNHDHSFFECQFVTTFRLWYKPRKFKSKKSSLQPLSVLILKKTVFTNKKRGVHIERLFFVIELVLTYFSWLQMFFSVENKKLKPVHAVKNPTLFLFFTPQPVVADAPKIL